MTLKEFTTLLKSTGLPVAYMSFDEKEIPDMPFITYMEIRSNNFGADGVVYQPVKRMQVDLFMNNESMERNIEAQETLENAFKKAIIFWQKTFEYNDDEKFQCFTYEVEII